MNLIAFVCWIEWYKKPNSKLAVLLGVVGSVAFLAQQMLFIFYGIIFLSAFYRVWQDRKNLVATIFLTVSFMIPIMTLLIYLFINNAWAGFYFWNYDWYRQGFYTFDKIGRGKNEILLLISVSSPILLACLVLIRERLNLNLIEKWYCLLFNAGYLPHYFLVRNNAFVEIGNVFNVVFISLWIIFTDSF